MLFEVSTQIDFQYLKFPENGETVMKFHHLYYMVHGKQHFQGVLVISSDILNNFLEVFGPAKALTRGMEPIGNYHPVCTNYPLRQTFRSFSP